ncbi:MAG: hypothetical protein IKX97_06030 [Erysipelotrichaceae bacterium]|nr:hypothetical protein [Erysipelotrichaceae bacterium]
MKQDEARKQHYIPENYSTGINLIGMNFKFRNVLEGGTLSVVFGIFGYSVISRMAFLDVGTMIGLVVSVAAIGLVLGITGLNDEPLSVYIANRLMWRRNRRSAFYNPHIKGWCIPYIYEYENEMRSLPREKIMAFYRNYRSDLEKKEREKILEFQKTNTFDETSMFFEDDEGYLEKPVEYMNPSEYRAYQKVLRKKKRQRKREEKRKQKLARKEEKQKRRKKG